MALVMPYTDDAGNDCPASYWRLTSMSIGAAVGRIDLTFLGWRDAGAWQSGLKPLAGAVKGYQIEGQEFLQVAMSPPIGGSLYDALANATEEFALNKHDTPGDAGPVSFFEGATQV